MPDQNLMWQRIAKLAIAIHLVIERATGMRGWAHHYSTCGGRCGPHRCSLPAGHAESRDGGVVLSRCSMFDKRGVEHIGFRALPAPAVPNDPRSWLEDWAQSGGDPARPPAVEAAMSRHRMNGDATIRGVLVTWAVMAVSNDVRAGVSVGPMDWSSSDRTLHRVHGLNTWPTTGDDAQLLADLIRAIESVP